MRFRWCCLVALLIAVTACAGTRGRPSGAISELSSEDASRLINIAEKKTDKFTPYKGIGEIRIYGKQGFMESRAAWMGAPDGRLRVEALGVTGRPFARMICTRDKCFFLFQEGDCLRRETAGNTDLSPLSGIAIKARDMVLLLGGGVGLADYDSAEAYLTDSGGKVLVLKKRFLGTVQTVRFSRDLGHVRETAVFGLRGRVYRAKITRREQIGSRMMPFELDISDDNGNRINVSVERCWIDINPGQKAFSPELPEGAGCGRH